MGKNSFYMDKPIKCKLTNIVLMSVCTLHVYDLYEWLRFCSSSTVLNSTRYKITSDTYLKSKTPKRKEWWKESRGTRSSWSALSSWPSSWPWPLFSAQTKGKKFQGVELPSQKKESETDSASFVSVTGTTLAKIKFLKMQVELLGKWGGKSRVSYEKQTVLAQKVQKTPAQSQADS